MNGRATTVLVCYFYCEKSVTSDVAFPGLHQPQNNPVINQLHLIMHRTIRLTDYWANTQYHGFKSKSNTYCRAPQERQAECRTST